MGASPRRVCTGLAMLLLACAGAASARLCPDGTAKLLDQAAVAARDLGVSGWIVAVMGQFMIALCGILPASMGALAAGAGFGIVQGFAMSGSATVTAAAVGFFLSRRVFRPLFAGALAGRPRVRRLDAAVARDGWRFVALLRVSPVMPFAMTSYALGLTSLGSRDYLLGTLAALPALLGYVALGSLGAAGFGSLTSGESRPLHLLLLAAATAATALLTLRLARILRPLMRFPADPVP